MENQINIGNQNTTQPTENIQKPSRNRRIYAGISIGVFLIAVVGILSSRLLIEKPTPEKNLPESTLSPSLSDQIEWYIPSETDGSGRIITEYETESFKLATESTVPVDAHNGYWVIASLLSHDKKKIAYLEIENKYKDVLLQYASPGYNLRQYHGYYHGMLDYVNTNVDCGYNPLSCSEDITPKPGWADFSYQLYLRDVITGKETLIDKQNIKLDEIIGLNIPVPRAWTKHDQKIIISSAQLFSLCNHGCPEGEFADFGYNLIDAQTGNKTYNNNLGTVRQDYYYAYAEFPTYDTYLYDLRYIVYLASEVNAVPICKRGGGGPGFLFDPAELSKSQVMMQNIETDKIEIIKDYPESDIEIYQGEIPNMLTVSIWKINSLSKFSEGDIRLGYIFTLDGNGNEAKKLDYCYERQRGSVYDESELIDLSQYFEK